MTTKVSIEVEYTNCPTGKMVVGVTNARTATLSLAEPPFKLEYWVSGDSKVVCREASDQDVADRA